MKKWRKGASFIDESGGKRDGADVTDHQQTACDGKRGVIFFGFGARRSKQVRAEERENPRLHLKAERGYAELLRALELNTC